MNEIAFFQPPTHISRNLLVFSQLLADFAQHFGIGERKRVILVLDQAAFHTSEQVRVPEGVHLLFLPAKSPELQSAERLWPDEQGLVQLGVKGLKAPEAEVVNWVQLQGQVKGRDKETGRLFIHLRRNRKDKNGQRPAWIMTVQGSVPKPGRYQLICSIEAGALALVDGQLLPDRQRRAEVVTSPSLQDPETAHRPAESLLVDSD